MARVLVTLSGERVCVDCELAGLQPCEEHRPPEPRSQGLMQVLPTPPPPPDGDILRQTLLGIRDRYGNPNIAARSMYEAKWMREAE